jgi:hypothetical protein
LNDLRDGNELMADSDQQGPWTGTDTRGASANANAPPFHSGGAFERFRISPHPCHDAESQQHLFTKSIVRARRGQAR